MTRLKTALLASALMLGTSGIAHAGFADGDSYQFQVWNGTYSDLGLSGTPAAASEATLTNLGNISVNPTAQFSYDGPIDFSAASSPSSSYNFSSFFGTHESGITGYSSPTGVSDTTFLGSSLSSPYQTAGSTVNPNAIVTFMEITGTYSAQAGTVLTISDDAGASLYIGNGTTPIISNSDATGTTSSSATLAAASENPFTLVYVAANGSPAVLQLTETVPVPEPGSLAVLGTGLLGLVLIRARRPKG